LVPENNHFKFLCRQNASRPVMNGGCDASYDGFAISQQIPLRQQLVQELATDVGVGRTASQG
jgi:hypothetical protein